MMHVRYCTCSACLPGVSAAPTAVRYEPKQLPCGSDFVHTRRIMSAHGLRGKRRVRGQWVAT